ncbi:MAG: 16S rRNA (cytosine(1402)-N(4))-methyltransferase RsmH [Bacteroidales bacterium]|nr:16S rRNA (cytosine(1402)-N(4))-methyltransferase RsmH [Bacteroidales bacterium]MDD4669881.1 16S rRNA (cytosine(1402)-N(4))-methyltransferase RsmH [Bacteroidales bacterium]
MSTYHTPVLLEKSVSALAIKADGVYVDATFGGGGHSREILGRLGKNGVLIAFDKDADALKNAPDDKRLILVHNDFRFVHNYVRYYGYDSVDGILADLGVSSHQFDTCERGFSFRFDAPLDMRMNILAGKSAEEIINSYSIEDLEKIFRIYGEVENSRKVAGLICASRSISPIKTTDDLGRAIESVLPKFSEHKYLAKIYQALRIEVNGEMESLEGFMKGAIKSLKTGGMVSVITYHSLEDRIVKNFFKSGTLSGEIERNLMGQGYSPYMMVNKKPIVPDEEEIASNTRARSAKLRVAQRR